MSKWDYRFLDLAKHVSRWSKDPSTAVGAVITDGGNRVVSLGYNGFPPGVEDREEWLQDRTTKYKLTRHAEANAIFYGARSHLPMRTIHVWPLPPCAQCAGAIIQAGIARIVAPWPDPSLAERWGEDWHLADEMYAHSGVRLTLLKL